MTQLIEEAREGSEARRLWEHPINQKVYQSLTDGLIMAMKGSAMGDAETHNRQVIALQILGQIEKSYQRFIDTGKLAQIQLDKGFTEKVKGLFKV